MYKYLVAVHVIFIVVSSATMFCWNYTTQINGTNQLLSRSRHRQKGSLCGRQSNAWMQISSWMSIPWWEAWWPPMPYHPTRDVCTCQDNSVQKEINWAIHCGHWLSCPGLNTKAEGPCVFSWLGLKPLEMKSGDSIMMSINCKGHQALYHIAQKKTEELVQEICTSLVEWLQQRLRQMKDQNSCPTSTLRSEGWTRVPLE